MQRSIHTSRFTEQNQELCVSFYADDTAEIKYNGAQVAFNAALEIEAHSENHLPLPEHILYEALAKSAQGYLDVKQPQYWSDRVLKARIRIDNARDHVAANNSLT